MINYSLSRLVASRMLQVYSLSRLNRGQHIVRCYSKTSEPDEIDESAPLKYSTSEAAKWRAKFSRQGGVDDDKPWEENDIDQTLSVSLYERVPGLEEQQLHLALKYNKKNGLDTKEIEERLVVLRKQRKEQSIE